jgi:hypothetical protein
MNRWYKTLYKINYKTQSLIKIILNNKIKIKKKTKKGWKT